MSQDILFQYCAAIRYKRVRAGQEVLEGVVTVSLALNLKYDYSIMEVTKKVQEKVKNAVENMTGLEVADVNIKVAGVEMEKQN